MTVRFGKGTDSHVTGVSALRKFSPRNDTITCGGQAVRSAAARNGYQTYQRVSLRGAIPQNRDVAIRFPRMRDHGEWLFVSERVRIPTAQEFPLCVNLLLAMTSFRC